uniref:BPTI/Kunitz inhibitor domain-containing protein n=1 Tax=Panagrolaimus superbus TaxID=310955 RepID=A0A914YH44_9BILA
MTLQGSNIPQPPVIAPYFGHRRYNPGEVVERGSLPSDPKPPKLSTPKPKTRMTMEDFENMMGAVEEESTAEFHAPGGSEGVEKGHYDEANDAMPGARPESESTAINSQLDSKPDKIAIEENPAEPNSVSPSQVQPADMPTDEGEEKGPYAHLRLKPFARQNKLHSLRANDSTAIDTTENENVQIRTSSQEDPFEIDGESTKKIYKEIFDLSMCQLRPSEGRQCREDESQPLTNLQYFYSIKDRKCKLFFHRGCGGNSNRFDTKADCEKACSSLMGH